VSDGDKFGHLGRPRRIWAVPACHGDIARLDRIHLAIADRFAVGDRLLYFGNYLGGGDPVGTIDRLLAFRTYLLAAPGMIANDVIYLRGVQEEIWSKLLQIQFAPNPHEVLKWMLDRGAEATLRAYGGEARLGLSATRSGAIAMTRWTSGLREAMRQQPGHNTFMSVLRRAAVTDETVCGPLLFVHAGLDPNQGLAKQGDSFWWEAGGFAKTTGPFENFKRLFRGSDPAGDGLRLDGYAVTLDAGCGNGGPLIAAMIMPDGRIIDVIKA
jgi:serine/threonine protein phosphatase 1